ncbi:group I truncated hemoglobin [Pseudoalteromonas sp. SSDWG2]|uniref:group I truncated hemoglobin n=1 Tax=Pseudoalteromonas sp. SSDWG2 TaxID=3139391 RepID=UPI003BAAF247
MMMSLRKLYTGAWMLTLCGCASSAPNDTLYDALGAQQGVASITDSFIKHIAKDEAIFPYFAKSSVSHFRQGFQTHICDISGGPCEYTGDTMEDIHTGMKINEADFNRVVELLIMALEDNGIDYPTQNRLLKLLAPMRSDVIKI